MYRNCFIQKMDDNTLYKHWENIVVIKRILAKIGDNKRSEGGVNYEL